MNKEKWKLESDKKDYQILKKKIKIQKKDLDTKEEKYQKDKEVLTKKKKKYVGEKKKEIETQKKNYESEKEKLRAEKEKLKKQQLDVEKMESNIKNLENELDISDSNTSQKLSPMKEKIIKNGLDMMETLLICLSLLPIAGWTFDFPLFIYALIKKKYNLAIITILNWFIWGFWIVFGLNVNLGPSMKVSYLGNKENYIKNGLLNGYHNTKKMLNPYTKVDIENIDGKKYLVDSKGNVYNPIVENPEIIGVFDKEQGKIIKKGDRNYYSVKSKLNQAP